MFFVDTHAHIFLKDFDADRDQVIIRAKEAGVKHILLPNIDSSSIESLIKTSNKYKGFCLPLMGFHPTSVKSDFEKELSIVEKSFQDNIFIGVGEIGIDLYWDKTYLNEQKKAFRYQLQLAKKLDLPVVIHTRNAFDEIFEIVAEENSSSLRGVFHSFSGSYEQYLRVCEFNGFYVGIGGVVTYKNSGLDEVVKKMDASKIVLETDSPYLSPVPMRGKRNESANIVYTAKKVSQLLNISIEEIAAITSQNAASLFSIQ